MSNFQKVLEAVHEPRDGERRGREFNHLAFLRHADKNSVTIKIRRDRPAAGGKKCELQGGPESRKNVTLV